MKVPFDVRSAALTFYINKCRELNHIAFFQWRSKFPNKYVNLEEVAELEQKRLMILLWSIHFSANHQPDIKVLTEEEIENLEKFYKKYEFADNTEHKFMI